MAILKVSFLYIGTLIGAGFASGRELALFFGNLSAVNVAHSSIFISLLFALFLIAGKQQLVKQNTLSTFTILICSTISTCTMIAGGEYLLSSIFNIPVLFGLILTLLSAIIVSLGIEKIKVTSSIVVPMIIVIIVIIFVKVKGDVDTRPFDITRPILYSTLDILIGGIIISKEGAKLTYKQIILACLFVFVTMGALLYMQQSIVLQDKNASLMPVYAILRQLNLGKLCGVMIAFAIFTTLLSALQTASNSLSILINKLKSKRFDFVKSFTQFPPFFISLIAYPCSFVGFDKIVDTLYPILSIAGVVFASITFIKLLIHLIGYIIKRAKSHKKLT